MHSADYTVARCPSVRPSVTRRYFIYRAKNILKRFSPSGSHTILVFADRVFYTYNGRPIVSRIWSIERCHFQRPWTTPNLISRSRHYLTLNISETAKDIAIVAIEGIYETVPSFLMVLFSMTLSDPWPSFQRHNITSNNSKWYKIELYLQWQTNTKSYGLSNGAIFNELERPLAPISRSRRYLTLNISETVRDTNIVSVE